MGEVVNLRQARKAKQRAGNEQRADMNRVKHSLTKAERRLAELTRQKQDAAVQGARRERDEGGDD